MKTKLIKVRIIREANLPRFTFKVGDIWEVRPDKLTKEGFKVGGGFLASDYYEIS